jgi:hypothetical protein
MFLKGLHFKGGGVSLTVGVGRSQQNECETDRADVAETLELMRGAIGLDQGGAQAVVCRFRKVLRLYLDCVVLTALPETFRLFPQVSRGGDPRAIIHRTDTVETGDMVSVRWRE